MWGTLSGRWVLHDTRDEIVNYVRHWSKKMELASGKRVRWIGLGTSKFYDRKRRYGQVNEHNAQVPRDHWLEEWEKQAILAFNAEQSTEGYRRLMEQDLVAASPATDLRLRLSNDRIA